MLGGPQVGGGVGIVNTAFVTHGATVVDPKNADRRGVCQAVAGLVPHNQESRAVYAGLRTVVLECLDVNNEKCRSGALSPGGLGVG